jgi:putative Holliday junction resolvase
VGRALAVDLGTRRVGLALSDPLRLIASPFKTIPFVSLTRLADSLSLLCRENAVDLVVVGLPVREDGTEGAGAERSRKLVEMLRGRGVRAVAWDESWSSRDAEEILRGAGETRRSAGGKVDAVAASLVLREFLDSGPADPA